jgi:YHS domain-containing protein
MTLRNLALALALAAPFSVAQDAKKTEFKGKTYYFCSIDDKKEFDKAPSTYIKLEKKDTTKK